MIKLRKAKMQVNRNEVKKLRLQLTSQWFEMTKAGKKKEDYREITPYWFKRLVYDYKNVFKYCTSVNWDDVHDEYRQLSLRRIPDHYYNMIGFNQYDINTVTLGYPKNTETERILNLEHKGVEIRTGNPAWGAEPGKLYFVIKHGNIKNQE